MRGSHMMAAASAMFSRVMAERQRRQTQRFLDSLPDRIRQDIGWSIERSVAPAYIAR